jgi:hypothetical protein
MEKGLPGPGFVFEVNELHHYGHGQGNRLRRQDVELDGGDEL